MIQAQLLAQGVALGAVAVSVGYMVWMRGKAAAEPANHCETRNPQLGEYEGFRPVRHDLLELQDAATVFVAGKVDMENVVFFCAGFPCDHSSFIPLAAYLANECGCLVGVSCLPEFDRVGPPLRPEGYDMDETTTCFGQGVDALLAQATAATPKLTLIVHDFGIVPGFMYSNSVGCDKLVVFDVLPGNPLKDAPDRMYYALVQTNYQAMFATSFLLSRLCPPLGWAWLTVGNILIFGVFGRWLNCIGALDFCRSGVFCRFGLLPWHTPDKQYAGSVIPTPFHCNPYWHTLKTIGSPKANAALLKKMSFDESLKRQPICFIYGMDKNTQFHTEVQLTKLRVTPGCCVHAVPEAGHWCYKHAPTVCFAAARNFILTEM